MTKKRNFDDMPLTKLVRAWMDEEDWKDAIDVAEDRKRSYMVTNFAIGDQPHQLLFHCDEELQQFFVYLYTPVAVPPARMGVMPRILNHINMRLNIGRFACDDDDEDNPVQFRAAIDVEGSSLTLQQITGMLNAAVNAMEHFGSVLAVAALTKQSADKIWKDFLAEEAAFQITEEEAGPSEL